jgi:hypothetical protein
VASKGAWVGVLIVVGLLTIASGCQSQKEAAQEASTLKPLALLYGQFIGQHRGQPPKTEAEFKAFVDKQGKPMLDTFHVDNAESLFVSPRDKKPYVVRYGSVTGPPGPAGQPVIAYEQEGVGGKRYVASNLGAVDEVDEATFQQLVPSK